MAVVCNNVLRSCNANSIQKAVRVLIGNNSQMVGKLVKNQPLASLVQIRFTSQSGKLFTETSTLIPSDISLRSKEKNIAIVGESKEELRERIGGARAKPTRTEILKDFKYNLIPYENAKDVVVDDRFKNVEEKDRPLVFLFGWAGATQKNLRKYTQIYQKAGCHTLGYNLPGRFVFIDTSEVPTIAKEIYQIIEGAKLQDQPLVFHIMSDTGLMVFQGLEIVSNNQGKKMNIVGTVLDSCPGPRPLGTLTRLTVYGVVNWFCSRAEGHSLARSIKETRRYIETRFIPSFKRYFQGLPVELSMMNNTWAGDFYRDAKNRPWPELFLYSKTDKYLPWQYLENEVLKPREEAGRDFTTKCWQKSGHVAHLRANPKEYEQAVLNFLFEKHFKVLKNKKF